MSSKLHKFYCSKAWRDLAHNLKVERGFKCERTGQLYTQESDLIAHHKIELTEENLDDPTIALNPDLIEILAFSEHNKEHRRFGNERRVYIVYGSPLSGKSTMVREMMRSGDIAVDIDALWRAVTLQNNYEKPNALRFNVFSVRDNLIDQIRTRYGKWVDAYIIGGYPSRSERERLAKSLNAELIYCEATKGQCLARRKDGEKPAVWDEYIYSWWDKYQE